MGHSYSRLIFFLALGGCPKAADPPADPAPTPKLAVLDAAAPAPTLPPPRGNVEVRLLGKPGAFQVVNLGDDIELSRDVVVEREGDGGVAVTLQLIDGCGTQLDAGACLSLPARATFTPVPWTGNSCDVQCPRPCFGNVLLTGRFRYVVRTCDGRRRWQSAWFTLPPSKL